MTFDDADEFDLDVRVPGGQADSGLVPHTLCDAAECVGAPPGTDTCETCGCTNETCETCLTQCETCMGGATCEATCAGEQTCDTCAGNTCEGTCVGNTCEGTCPGDIGCDPPEIFTDVC